jgi:hypothetical protein
MPRAVRRERGHLGVLDVTRLVRRLAMRVEVELTPRAHAHQKASTSMIARRRLPAIDPRCAMPVRISRRMGSQERLTRAFRPQTVGALEEGFVVERGDQPEHRLTFLPGHGAMPFPLGRNIVMTAVAHAIAGW